MPSELEPRYSLTELADLAGVTPRTVRYYISQGLLAVDAAPGPGPKYDEGHLARLRLIRRLQREHQPLAEIRRQLDAVDDDTILALAAADEPPTAPSDSALDYIRRITGGPAEATRRIAEATPGLTLRRTSMAPPAASARFVMPLAGPAGPPAAASGPSSASPATPDMQAPPAAPTSRPPPPRPSRRPASSAPSGNGSSWHPTSNCTSAARRHGPPPNASIA